MNLYRLCRMCGRYRREHLLLFGQHICATCERALLRSRAGEEPYERFIRVMRSSVPVGMRATRRAGARRLPAPAR